MKPIPKYLSPYITTVVDGVKTYTRRELGRDVPCILITKVIELGNNMPANIFRDIGYDPFENGDTYYEWSINTGKFSMPDIWGHTKTVKDAKKAQMNDASN